MRQIFLALVAFSLLTAYTVHAGQSPDADYDRLDGTGPSHEKVQVIEWEDNLEVHVYPKGSLQGLGMKLDKQNKDRPVMVLSYRFGGKPLIRRAILGIDLKDNFKVFKDPSEEEFDKIIVSNNAQDSPVVAFRLDPAPTQLYPDGYAVALTQSKQMIASNPVKLKQAVRAPAEENPGTTDSEESDIDSDAAIQPFFMRGDAGGRAGR